MNNGISKSVAISLMVFCMISLFDTAIADSDPFDELDKMLLRSDLAEAHQQVDQMFHMRSIITSSSVTDLAAYEDILLVLDKAQAFNDAANKYDASERTEKELNSLNWDFRIFSKAWSSMRKNSKESQELAALLKNTNETIQSRMSAENSASEAAESQRKHLVEQKRLQAEADIELELKEEKAAQLKLSSEKKEKRREDQLHSKSGKDASVATVPKMPEYTPDRCANSAERIIIGCPFPLAKVGGHVSDYLIQKTSVTVTRLLVEQEAAIYRNCDNMAESAYVAYSPYKDGIVIVVRHGVVAFEKDIDRVLAKDYMDPSKNWAPWTKGPSKGFLLCDELDKSQRNSRAEIMPTVQDMSVFKGIGSK